MHFQLKPQTCLVPEPRRVKLTDPLQRTVQQNIQQSFQHLCYRTTKLDKSLVLHLDMYVNAIITYRKAFFLSPLSLKLAVLEEGGVLIYEK